MSNFDHTIDPGMAEALKAGGVFSRHAAMNFNAKVWWADGQFHSEPWVYGSPRSVLSADTLDELMSMANEIYGYE